MNDPLLFIDSVNDKVEATSNQEVFDSRNKTAKDKAKYRLDDIEAMLYYRIRVVAEIYTKANKYEGLVLSCDKNGINLQTDEKNVFISLDEIEFINILKL